MLLLTSDFTLMDIDEIKIQSNSWSLNHIKDTVIGCYVGRTGNAVGQFMTTDLFTTEIPGEARKFISLVVAAINDGARIVSVPEIVAKMQN